MLGWLWDLSVAEEHIFSKAFFYFVCLDVMLYSGKCSSGTEKKVGVAPGLGSEAAPRAEALRLQVFRLGGVTWMERLGVGLRSHLAGAKIVEEQQEGDSRLEDAGRLGLSCQ